MKLALVSLGSLGALAALASCAPVGDRSLDFRNVADDQPVRVLGEAESCITTSALRETRVRDEQTIDFEVAGGKVYRNTLPSQCPRLSFNRGFTYDTPTGQLCRGEVIYSIERAGADLERGVACGIGQFVPIEYVEPVSDAPMIMGNEG